VGKILEGRVSIITGAASGIGRATALVFAREGARLALADVNEDGGAETLAGVRAAGAEATFTRCDVAEERAVNALVAGTVAHFGRLDCAFNNAGVENDPKPLAEMPIDAYDRLMAVNVRGVFLCLKAEIPAMQRNGKGAIVNTASVAGLVGAPGLSPYVASKHAVVGLTKTVSAEVASTGIRVNAVCPGLIKTPMLDRLEAVMGPAALQTFVGMTPIQRLAQPSEVGEAVAWLCSDAASFVTGFPMAVDGGFVSV
jgi:NAD(P)-dependent dehydrogenase (short-subunit alcohol dehydrogenase family)